MAKLNPGEQAQRLALQGDIEAALVELEALRRKGDVGASASLAEIAAYQGRWQDVLRHAETVVASPASLDTFNVYVETLALVARASAELSAWADAQRLAKLALSKLPKKGDDETSADAARCLAAFAKNKGKGPAPGVDEPEDSMDRRKAKFDAAVAKMTATKKKFLTPADRLDHLYGLASVYGFHPGAVLVYDREKVLPDIFDNVAFAASALARGGRGDEAWQAIRAKVGEWWPVERTQIAPVILLADPALAEVMTPARCAEILRTPRGPAGEGK